MTANPATATCPRVRCWKQLGVLLALAWPGMASGVQLEVVVQRAETGGGHFTSVALDSRGYPHVSHASPDEGANRDTLRYSRWDGARWTSQCVDQTGAYTSIALDAQDRPHVVYNNPDWTGGNDGGFYYAHLDGEWRIRQLDNDLGWISRDMSLKLDTKGRPHVIYYHTRNPNKRIVDNLRYAYYDGRVWSSKLVKDTNAVNDQVGKWNSMVLDGAGNVSVAFFDRVGNRDGRTLPLMPTVNYGLSLAVQSKDVWTKHILDNPTRAEDNGYFVSMFIDKNGVRHLAYFNADFKQLRYLREGGKPEAVANLPWANSATLSAIGTKTAIVVNGDGVPFVAFVDFPTGTPRSGDASLRVAYRAGTQWTVVPVDSGGVGLYASMAMSPKGNIVISYADYVLKGLKVAFLVDRDQTPSGSPFGVLSPAVLVSGTDICATKPASPRYGEGLSGTALQIRDWIPSGPGKKAYLLVSVVLILLPLCVMKPHLGILAWVWISLMNPHRLAGGFAEEYAVAQIVAIPTLTGIVLAMFRRQLQPFPSNWQTRLLILLWLSFTMTSSFAVNKEVAWTKWEMFTKIILMGLPALVLFQDKYRLKLLFAVMAASIGIYGVKGGIFGLMTAGQYRIWGPKDTMIEDNNALAVAELMVLPIMIFLGQNEPRWYLRWMWFGGAVLTFISVVLSYSRSAFIALVAMTGLIILWKSQRKGLLRSRIFRIGVLLALLPVAFNFVPEQWTYRMSTITTYDEDQSAMSRFNQWVFAYRLALDRPLTGGGFGAFNAELFQRYAPNPDEVYNGHSIYFQVLGEHGFLGLTVYVAFLVATLLALRKVRRGVDGVQGLEWAASAARMLQLGLTAYAVGGAFLPLAYIDLFYYVAIGAIVLGAIVRQELERRLMSGTQTDGHGAMGDTVSRDRPAIAVDGQGASHAPRGSAI